MPELAPPGSWPSPIGVAEATGATVRLGEVRVSSAGVWWSEVRPTEGGRHAICRRSPHGDVAEVTPPGWSARTRVHEYGGGGWWVADEVLFAVDDRDGHLYRLDPGFDPAVLTPPTPEGVERRVADGVPTPDRRHVVCVEELHGRRGEAEALNRLVAIDAAGRRSEPVVLWDAADFVAAPRLDARGEHLAWIAWRHPDMPWDAAELWVAGFDTTDGVPSLVSPERVAVAGGPAGPAAVGEPSWDPQGRLWFLSDSSGWSNLWMFELPGRPRGRARAIAPASHDVGSPMWQLGDSRYAHLSDGRVVFAATSDGTDHLAVVDPASGVVDRLDVGLDSARQVRSDATTVVLVAGSFRSAPAVLAHLVGRGGSGSSQTVRSTPADTWSSAYLSEAQPITFPVGSNGSTARALFYPPTNPTVEMPAGTAPPAIVMIHGGPTSRARSELDVNVQFWTSRGFAVVDVNYRGSSGFGRDYMRQLDGRWGVADVEDCVAAVLWLAGTRRVDPNRCVIRGGSAGGFTVLRALLDAPEVFAAGTTRYGVVDLEALAHDTHKFESRYLDRLIGPYPAAVDVYTTRSPRSSLDRLGRPVLVQHGGRDRVVPPSQAEMIVDALRSSNVPHAYQFFPEEGHGFVEASSLQAALAGELSFYCQVLGLPHPADVEQLPLLGASADDR